MVFCGVNWYCPKDSCYFIVVTKYHFSDLLEESRRDSIITVQAIARFSNDESVWNMHESVNSKPDSPKVC